MENFNLNIFSVKLNNWSTKSSHWEYAATIDSEIYKNRYAHVNILNEKVQILFLGYTEGIKCWAFLSAYTSKEVEYFLKYQV